MIKRKSYETTISAMGHRISLAWWGIDGDIAEAALAEEGEARAMEMIAQGYVSGDLNHEGDGTSARGWWKIL